MSETIQMFDSMHIPSLYEETSNKIVFIWVICEKVSNLALLSPDPNALNSLEFLTVGLYITFKNSGNQARHGLIYYNGYQFRHFR